MTLDTMLTGSVLVIFLTLIPVFTRMFMSPVPADRMLGVLALGTSGGALLALLSEIQSNAALLDVALSLSLLSAVGILTFTRIWSRRTPS